ncbi:MAG: efflux RND transporter permease subunit, partial [Pseudomonadota bacterium]
SYLNNRPAVALAFFQRPGTNALEAAAEIQTTMETLAQDFPPGLTYDIVYNPTDFIAQSIDRVYRTLFEAMLLVALVMVVFLQSWRTALIPLLAIPVSLIGTFAVLFALGFSLNLLTLFGLVLAIGIVVDDAIVVIENVERNIENGIPPREAAHRTMDEVAGALISTTLVLVAVFVPTAFVPGIEGRFYIQFAITISVATIISSFNSLTLTPALAAILLKPIDHEAKPGLVGRFFGLFARGFNAAFDALIVGYSALIRILIRGWVQRIAMLLVFAGLLAGTVTLLRATPQGFIPPMDQGYAIVVVTLPDGASLSRTDAVARRASEIMMETPGVADAIAFAGFSAATFTNATNAAAIFAPFDPFDERLPQGLTANAIIGDLFGRLSLIQEAFIIAVPPPSVRGIGNSGGIRLQLQDRLSSDVSRVLETAFQLIGMANQTPGLVGVFTTFSDSSPQYFLQIERDKARMLNVPLPNIFDALAINFGSSYVNDFNAFGRVFQVQAQADADFRENLGDILRLKVRSNSGALVPLGTVLSIRDASGPSLVQRYNMFVSVPIQATPAPGTSTGEALQTLERLANEVMPAGMTYAWTELAFQQTQAGDEAVFIFVLAVLFAFLAMAANYESWMLPFAIILIVPLGVFSALVGVNLRGLDNNILTQVGLIVLVALAAKNAILIVEFARQQEAEGRSRVESAIEACRIRLRPIL